VQEQWGERIAGEPNGCGSESEIPAAEYQRLALRLADARDWAERGRPALGYAVLMQGLMHAERSLLAGEPWAPVLISSWRTAIDRFCTEYDPQREE
jgi:hypothetical protein